MPIKFSCPHCKNVMTVDSKFAGKRGKCNKCGNQVTVPANAQQPQVMDLQPDQLVTAPSIEPASSLATGSQHALNMAAPLSKNTVAAGGSLGHVLDELTESDYNRHSPFQNVYSPPKPKAENNELLKRAESIEDSDKGGKKGKLAKNAPNQLPKQLAGLVGIDFLAGILNYGLAIALAVVGAQGLGNAVNKIPFLGAGPAFGVIIAGFLGTAFVAAGLGLSSRQVWGFAAAAGIHSFNAGFTLLMFIANVTDSDAVRWRSGPVIATFVMASYFFREFAKKPYGIKKGSKLPYIAGGVGLTLGLLIGVALMMGGVFTPVLPGTE